MQVTLSAMIRVPKGRESIAIIGSTLKINLETTSPLHIYLEVQVSNE